MCNIMNTTGTELDTNSHLDSVVPTPRIQNVVSTYSIGLEKLNLKTLVLRCGFLDFDSSDLPCCDADPKPQDNLFGVC